MSLLHFDPFDFHFFTWFEDDVDIDDDLKEKPRGKPVLAGFNKNISNRFQAIKGMYRIFLTKF